jgi:hypothetical protein
LSDEMFMGEYEIHAGKMFLYLAPQPLVFYGEN